MDEKPGALVAHVHPPPRGGDRPRLPDTLQEISALPGPMAMSGSRTMRRRAPKVLLPAFMERTYPLGIEPHGKVVRELYSSIPLARPRRLYSSPVSWP